MATVMREGMAEYRRKSAVFAFVEAFTFVSYSATFSKSCDRRMTLDDDREREPQIHIPDDKRLRRARLDLRPGLGRDIPPCIVHWEIPQGSPRRSIQSTATPCSDGRRTSNMTHLTIMEGIPERWMEHPKRLTQSTEFYYTPIEGVPERVMERSEMMQRISVITDIEGVPERQRIAIERSSASLKHFTEADGDASPDRRGGEASRARGGNPKQPIAIRVASSVSDPMIWESAEVGDGTPQSSGFFEMMRAPLSDDRSTILDRKTIVGDDDMHGNDFGFNFEFPPFDDDNAFPDDDVTFVNVQNEIEIENQPDSATHDAPKRSSLLGNHLVQNLAVDFSGSDLGMHWVDGCRRSTRNRCKPLRWWDGEHKVYGRDHNTLATVKGYVKKTPDPEWPRPSTKTARSKRTR